MRSLPEVAEMVGVRYGTVKKWDGSDCEEAMGVILFYRYVGRKGPELGLTAEQTVERSISPNVSAAEQGA